MRAELLKLSRIVCLWIYRKHRQKWWVMSETIWRFKDTVTEQDSDCVANSESEHQMEKMVLQPRVRCLWLASLTGFPIISPWVECVSLYTACVFTNRSSNSVLKYQNKLLLVDRLCWHHVQAGDLIWKRWLLEKLRLDVTTLLESAVLILTAARGGCEKAAVLTMLLSLHHHKIVFRNLYKGVSLSKKKSQKCCYN